jgi:hypothetical protein
MGTLLRFQPPSREERTHAPQAELGKLLLFTGIRYERAPETEEEEKPRRRRVRSRRRT